MVHAEYIKHNTSRIPNWKVIMTGTAGRLGKRIPVEAFEFTGDTERPLPFALLLHKNAQPLVIWRKKVCIVTFSKTLVKTVVEWRETGIYFVPMTRQLYLVQEGCAYEVDTGKATRALIFKAHRAVLQ